VTSYLTQLSDEWGIVTHLELNCDERGMRQLHHNIGVILIGNNTYLFIHKKKGHWHIFFFLIELTPRKEIGFFFDNLVSHFSSHECLPFSIDQEVDLMIKVDYVPETNIHDLKVNFLQPLGIIMKKKKLIIYRSENFFLFLPEPIWKKNFRVEKHFEKGTFRSEFQPNWNFFFLNIHWNISITEIMIYFLQRI